MSQGGTRVVAAVVSVLAVTALWAPTAAADDVEVADQCASVGVSPAPGVGRSVTVCVVSFVSPGQLEPVEPPEAGPRESCALERGVGVTVGVADGQLDVCVSHSTQPGLPPVDVGGPPDVGAAACPDGFHGRVLLVGDGGHVTVCVEVVIIPTLNPFPIGVDLTPCPGGFDPAVFTGDGGVAVCVIVEAWPPVVSPPSVDDLPEVDLSPCSEGFDPSVTWGNLGVAFCVQGTIEPPGQAPIGGTEDPCERAIGLNATAANQTAVACLAFAP